MAPYLRLRMRFLVTLLVGAALMLTFRLVHVQIALGEELRQRAQAERERQLVLPEPRWGEIYDRDGFSLAVDEPRYAIEANPPFVKNVPFAAERLAAVLQVSSETLEQVLSEDVTWVSLEPFATVQQGEAVQQLGLDGVDARLRWVRWYPQGARAAHVLGFVSRGGEGFYGLEGYYDRVLRPRAAVWEGETGPSGRWPLPQEEGTVPPPVGGNDLVLTLDLAVQAVVEEELAWGVERFGAEGGTVIVMDPRSGAVLAMASLPSFDPNLYDRYIFWGEEDRFLSPAVGTQYEPGSVFKIVTVAAALDSGRVAPQSTYVDTGQIEVGGRVYANWDGKAYGEQDLVGLLGHSLNVGAVWLALQMGPEPFYRYVRAFGFGQPTGIDLQGEAIGQVRVPGDLDWHDSDLGANSFGQGLAATPIQMASAVAAVANGGRLMRPYLVARQVLPDGGVVESRPVVRGQPISPETARAVTEFLAQAVERWVPQAHVPGYRIAGKTGTSQIPIPGGYDPRWTIASFVGYGPVEEPQLLILVRLDRPRVSPWGSETAAVVFSRLATRLFPMLGIAP